MIINIEISRKIFNLAYVSLLDCKSRFLNLCGGRGSGKSVFSKQKTNLRLLEEPGHIHLSIRKVAQTVRNSSWRLHKSIHQEWGVSNLWQYNKNEMSAKCVNSSEIISAGLDDPEKLKSIPHIDSIDIEEATELTRQDLMDLNLLLRGKSPYYKQIILTYNPISSLHWLKDMFWDHTYPGNTNLKTTWRDNRFLDEEYIAELQYLKEQNYQLWMVSSEGEWGLLEDLIFTNWEVRPGTEFPNWDYFGGMDFGFTHPNVLVRLAMREDILWIKQEIYEKRKTTNEFIQLVDGNKFGKDTTIWADAEDPGAINEFYEAGYHIQPADKSKGSVKASINACKEFRKIYITDDSPDVIKEIQTYSWKRDKMTGLLLDEPVKAFDDAMSAMRYGAYNEKKNQTSDFAFEVGSGKSYRRPN